MFTHWFISNCHSWYEPRCHVIISSAPFIPSCAFVCLFVSCCYLQSLFLSVVKRRKDRQLWKNANTWCVREYIFELTKILKNTYIYGGNRKREEGSMRRRSPTNERINANDYDWNMSRYKHTNHGWFTIKKRKLWYDYNWKRCTK